MMKATIQIHNNATPTIEKLTRRLAELPSQLDGIESKRPGKKTGMGGLPLSGLGKIKLRHYWFPHHKQAGASLHPLQFPDFKDDPIKAALMHAAERRRREAAAAVVHAKVDSILKEL